MRLTFSVMKWDIMLVVVIAKGMVQSFVYGDSKLCIHFNGSKAAVTKMIQLL